MLVRINERTKSGKALADFLKSIQDKKTFIIEDEEKEDSYLLERMKANDDQNFLSDTELKAWMINTKKSKK